MAKNGNYQRDYNIISFEPVRLTRNAQAMSEPILPKIAPTSTRLDKNFSTFTLSDNPIVKNRYPFEDVILHMKEKKRYDPLLESKITSETKYDKNSRPTLFNSSGLDYDFISFAKKKNPVTLNSIQNNNPQATFKRSAVSEFNHIGRVTAPNFNNNFREVYGKDQFAFRRRTGMGGQYLDSKRTYGEIASCFKRSGK